MFMKSKHVECGNKIKGLRGKYYDSRRKTVRIWI